jgi:hypothetical protein
MLIAVALAFCFSAHLAYADGESVSGCANCNGYSFTASISLVSGSTSEYKVVYTITNNGGPAAIPYNWSLTAFDNGNSVTAPAPPTVMGSNNVNYSGAYQLLAGKSNNGNSNCNGTLSSAFCVQQTGIGTLPVLGAGTGQLQSLMFTFYIDCSNCGLMSSWDFLSSGNPPGNGSGNVYAITNWGTPTSMPEPSVVLLYASTLVVGLVFTWRSRVLRRTEKS